MKKLALTVTLAIGLASTPLGAAPWTDPYLDRVRDLDNATLEKLVAGRDMPATVQLARNLVMDEVDTERGLRLIRTAADAGVPSAEYVLGGWLWHCVGGCRDKLGGVQWLERAAQAGHPVANEALGGIYEYGSDHVKKDPGKAYKYYLVAAKGGIGHAQLSAALMLCAGTGVEKDIKAGRRWLDLAQKDQQVKYSYEEAGCE